MFGLTATVLSILRWGWRGGSTRHTPAPDSVNRDFTTAGPNQLWVADVTTT